MAELARRISILVNPGSGKRRGAEKLREVTGAASAHPEVTVRKLERHRPLADQAQSAVAEGYDIVAAAGGDGTICGIAAALAKSGQVMGVLPLGTFNYFARSLDIPQELGPALDLLRTGEARPINVGSVNDRLFLNNASLGAYPSILKSREEIYSRWGRSRVAAYWSVLVALCRRSHSIRLRLVADGQEHRFRTPLVFIMLNAYQLRQHELDGEDIIRRGKFAVFVAPDLTRFGMIRTAIGLATGRLEKARDFTLIEARELLIDTGRPRDLVARDGERETMRGPFRFTLLSDALRVIAPAVGQTADPA
ncbi:diacylglycerol/lipid kinase family protein [Halodurantibacterium flavum]|uniref:Diacylglycerol/lipid kinase family protein n=1 Tax=Halodurantibacterium flavum TaxID=1382802 RepID=A0ABW4S609_9RHOB